MLMPLLADVAPPIPFLEKIGIMELIVIGVLGLLGLAIIGYFLLRSFGGGAAPASEQSDLSIDVNKLGVEGPPPTGPQLDVYNIPMRLAVLVIAPLGRANTIPPPEVLTAAVERIVPGMMSVLKTHGPVFRRWPAQLSAAGFGPTFFGNIPLPGDQGKGTSWTGVVGKFEYQGQMLAVGMILRADQPNSLGQIALERETQWLDVLRVRNV